MNKTNKIALIGSGSWATAIAKMLHLSVDVLHWYIREQEIIDHMKLHSHNPLYLSAIQFDMSHIKMFNNVDDAIRDVEIVIFCIPSKFVKGLMGAVTVDLKTKKIVSAIKGIAPDDNMVISDFFIEKYGVSENDVAVISGPCHAEEVALERLSYLTIGAKDRDLASYISETIQSYYIRTCISQDVTGIEYSAVMKNIMALAAGICHGLGYGDNFTSVLISNAIQEIKRFVEVANPLERDINDSVYLGDLLVTAYSQFSRNRTFGTMIGKGYSVRSAELEMSMIAEGYYAVNSIKQINDTLKVDMPITDAVYNILYDRIAPAVEFKLLSERLR